MRCGCGRHFVNINDPEIIRYNQEWWLRLCLVHLDKRLPNIVNHYNEMRKEVASVRKLRAKFVLMKNYMKKQNCYYCGYPVGNRFVHHKDELICGSCYERYI